MPDPTLAGSAPAHPLDPRLRDLLGRLPDAEAAIVDALVRDRDRLVLVAERRAERLQRLHDVSASLSRSLDQEEIERELARQVGRMIACPGVIVARAGEPGEAAVTLHWRDGNAQAEPPPEAALAAVTEVARTGRASRGAGTVAGSPPADSAVLAVPLRAGYKLAGVIAVYGNEAGAFGGEEEELLHTLGSTAATALANAALFAESLRDKRQSEAMAELAGALGSSLRLPDILRLSLRHTAALLGAEAAVVALKRGDYLHIVTAEGTAVAVQGLYVPIADSASGRAMLEGRSFIANDASAVGGNERVRTLGKIQKSASAPLLTPEGPIGLLSVWNRPADFTDADARVLERLAAQLALAVVNARLYEEASEATRELSAAFDAIAGGMAVVDGEGFIIRHNARLAACCGLPEGAPLAGRALFEALLREGRPVEDDDPIGTALRRGTVGRGTLRQSWSGKVFDLVASPHPAGGAVVTVDDVTVFHALTERHRLVVESTTDAIFTTSREGVIEFANDAAFRLFGRPGALAGLPLAALVPPEMTDEVRGHVQRALQGVAMRFNGAVLRAGGEERLVSMSLAPIREGGPVSGLIVSVRDVTDEARARDEVAVANARYRNLVEVAVDAIYTLDRAGIVTSANAACEALTGAPRDAILGRTIDGFIDPAESHEVAAHFRAALAGQTRRYECRFVRVDGRAALVSVSTTPIRRGAEVVGVLGVARDVTDERARAAALERAEARYSRLVESAEDAICTLDEEGNFTAVNRALARVVGRPRPKLLGTHFTDLLPAEERADKWRVFAATLAGGRERGELRFVAVDGVLRTATVLTAPVFERGRISGILAILRDVTEERALLDQMVRREKLAALGELVGGVAHEVNSPLTSILAFAQMLQEGQADASDSRKVAETIANEAKRAARIVTKLLTFARQNPAEKMRTDLNQVLRDTVELRRYPLRMQEIGLTLELADTLPETWADPFQMQQVFINLLSNAEQALAAQAGARRVTIRTAHVGDEVVATIADSGPGIAPGHLPHIFNPFYTTKPQGSGTGLGLSISFGIVREHGGSLRVRSEPGKGAAFDVALPVLTSPPGTRS